MIERNASTHCVLTGAASGIGLALAERLLAAGWQVTGVDIAPAAITDNAQYLHLVCDLSDPVALQALCARLDGCNPTAFVHCAGLVRTGGALDTRPEDAALLWSVHGAAPIALVRALAPQLPDGRGRIVLVSSRAVLGRANRLAYAATKSAQIGLARSLAAELIGRGVTVNVIAPGAVDTPMLSDPKRGAAPSVQLPLGRLIEAREVAASIAFFLSDDAGAITGQTLYVCGGASLGSMTL
ncbi:SDR family NAD(P)-dependent oxidoreductase [Achromobacter piechaudii]|uniref:3-oxoacyl-[acyl-carrier-protein] reductase FabG n=1 Tax=Achromobacter piechaudii TaxID=72556 RepID=A0ABM8L3A5_9BURK|nr:SDR family oxidoreductase [Achromobacter piechaudii]CAB3731093.1 3-oxoacyl-[acyl-carrier-protein] reductase FabG [Achromobacter piechaudii]CAB3908664.1 3-oxoacyl-[acyl-carrier-protein] reductase FabG [Achromobacter piechaudii]CAB3954572.1 3-oxoacyl-[acyl-carrier-protein] reductase FabG [Achromobacter piechaudii]